MLQIYQSQVLQISRFPFESMFWLYLEETFLEVVSSLFKMFCDCCLIVIDIATIYRFHDIHIIEANEKADECTIKGCSLN